MSNGVRGTSGAQGNDGLAVGGSASASRGAPADGASFGGVLGAAMSGPAHPVAAPGDGSGHGDGKGDSKKNGQQSPASSDPTTALVADLASTAGGTLNSAAPASSGGTDVNTIATGTTGRSGKKRTSDASKTDPGQTAQAAIVAASIAPPTVNGSAAPTAAGSINAGAVGAATSIAAAAGGLQGGRTAANLLTPGQDTAPIKGALTSNKHQLVGPEDGTGPREPDGIDPAKAAVGRPAATLSSGVTASLSSAVSPSSAAPAVNSNPAKTDSTAASASGSLDGQTVTTAATPSTSAPTATVVFAALASSERDPNHAPSANNDNGMTVGAAGATNSLSSVATANVMPGVTLGTQQAPAAVNGSVNVVTPDGTSQPLPNALTSQILTMVAAGRNQVTVHLSPPDLGALTVHVEVQSHDVSAWFASPQPQVQQAVTDALTQLHGSLSGAGLNLSGAWVGADVSGGGNGRPAATPLPVRRGPTAPGRVDPTIAGTTPVEGLSVYA